MARRTSGSRGGNLEFSRLFGYSYHHQWLISIILHFRRPSQPRFSSWAFWSSSQILTRGSPLVSRSNFHSTFKAIWGQLKINSLSPILYPEKSSDQKQNLDNICELEFNPWFDQSNLAGKTLAHIHIHRDFKSVLSLHSRTSPSCPLGSAQGCKVKIAPKDWPDKHLRNPTSKIHIFSTKQNTV